MHHVIDTHVFGISSFVQTVNHISVEVQKGVGGTIYVNISLLQNSHYEHATMLELIRTDHKVSGNH